MAPTENSSSGLKNGHHRHASVKVSHDPVSMIQVKRTNSRPHTTEEIEWWIQQYVLGKIPDYQMSAWLMAVCWRGLDAQETATLTRCMVESGAQLQWSNNDDDGVIMADKHSSGGVGDKISLVLAPLVACLGVKVPMMSGRGLGHTGRIFVVILSNRFSQFLGLPNRHVLTDNFGLPFCCVFR
jgi:hypothetical protein